jgi:LacI family transcriptional regulator
MPAQFPMPNIVTQAEIAARAGVSQAAVSCALRGHSNIPADTCARVQRAARELGYQPNPLLSAHMAHLRALRKPSYRATIGFVTQCAASGSDDADLITRYWNGCVQRAADHGYLLERFRLDEENMSGPRLSRILGTRGIHGVIVAPLFRPDERMVLEWDRFSSVALGYSLREPALHRVCHHNFNTMQQLMERLADLGYRRIGLAIPASADIRVNHFWLGGYLAHRHYLQDLKHLPPLVSTVWSERTFNRWFKRNRPDAVVSSTTEPLQWLRAAGLRVPDDIGFASLFLARTAPGCSGFNQNFEQIAAAAVDAVIAQLHRNERGVPPRPQVVLVEGDWVPGRTVRPRKGSGPVCAPRAISPGPG